MSWDLLSLYRDRFNVNCSDLISSILQLSGFRRSLASAFGAFYQCSVVWSRQLCKFPFCRNAPLQLYFAPEKHIVHRCIIFCTRESHCENVHHCIIFYTIGFTLCTTDCVTLNYTKFKRGSLYSQDMTRGSRSPYLNIVHWQRTTSLFLLLEIVHCLKYFSLVDATIATCFVS